uniref:Uncharacterized protein n=1 Tax=Rhizophora mucronata TaxID=61149 RepID=A0A2P2NKU2_RHIMU
MENKTTFSAAVMQKLKTFPGDYQDQRSLSTTYRPPKFSSYLLVFSFRNPKPPLNNYIYWVGPSELKQIIVKVIQCLKQWKLQKS